MEPSDGFPPVAGPDARILVLGSLPGQRSIADQQYYAHPQNVFWRIMRELLGVTGNYTARCQQLVDHRIALWDVLSSSVRPGSMDADIRLDSACANDLAGFLAAHPDVCLIAFNGRKAEQLFGKFVDLRAVDRSIRRLCLPSTSPAYAAMPFSGKLAAWREAIRFGASESTARKIR